MPDLQVYIEINGSQKLIGHLDGNDSSDITFSYDKDYMKSTGAAAISISLPLREEAFSPRATRCFFEGLLPEGFTKRSVAKWLHADEDDYMSILYALGQECLGAIRICREEDAERESSYEKLSLEQVHALAREGAGKTAEIVTKSHLSLTGATGKVGLYLKGGEWYQPKGDAPSTHIVKQSHVRFDTIVLNEHLSLCTAKELGMETSESFVVNLGDGEDGSVLFASRRYDRLPGKTERPYRLHQEDFAQALGYYAAEKYEKPGQHFLREMFEILRNNSANPIEDSMKLWDMAVFDFLIGNTDNHIKNHSLLYSPNLQTMRLAPAYDIVSTCVYDRSTRDMAYNVGGKIDLDEIQRENFRIAARECGLSERLAMQHFDRMAEGYEAALMRAAEKLADAGLEKAPAMAKRIREHCGYAHL